jgi:hypothetical protein
MKCYITEKGYYYKELKSIKKRISEAEYNKYKKIEFDKKRFKKVMVGRGPKRVWGCSWCGINTHIPFVTHADWCPKHSPIKEVKRLYNFKDVDSEKERAVCKGCGFTIHKTNETYETKMDSMTHFESDDKLLTVIPYIKGLNKTYRNINNRKILKALTFRNYQDVILYHSNAGIEWTAMENLGDDICPYIRLLKLHGLREEVTSKDRKSAAKKPVAQKHTVQAPAAQKIRTPVNTATGNELFGYMVGCPEADDFRFKIYQQCVL